MSYSDQRECAICHSPITDNNPDGIGYTCRHVWKQARASAYYHFHGLALWSEKCEIAMRVFKACVKDVKFRSKFKQSFIPSVISQWDEKGRLSKKQLLLIVDICEGLKGSSPSEEWYALGGGWMEWCKSDEDEYGHWREDQCMRLLDIKRTREWQPTEDERQYIIACAKKGYAEASV